MAPQAISHDTLNALYGGIRDVPDFPEAGILFRDITPLLLDAKLFRQATEAMISLVRHDPPDKVMVIESRGFLFGAPLAHDLDGGLVLARKKGKLPWKTHQVEYELEYGTDTIEIHQDSIDAGERVLIVDDVLATGGTAAAAVRVVEQAGGIAAAVLVLIELSDLDGRAKIGPVEVHSVLQYPRDG